MKPDLRDQLREELRGRVCVVGVGNPDRGDDGFGVRLAEALAAAGYPHVVIAEKTPESWIRAGSLGFECTLLLDAVQLGVEPGSAVFLDAGEIEARYPQVSTHKLSLGLLAKMLQSYGARVWLLGVQPQALDFGAGLSTPVQRTVDVLTEVLLEVLPRNVTDVKVGCAS